MRTVVGILVLLGTLVLAGGAKAALVEDWFEEEGQATLQSYAPSVFPDLSEEERSELSIGEPEPAVSLDDRSTDPRAGDREPDSYVAPIELEDDIVGVIALDIVDDGGDEAEVFADPYFGEQIENMRETDQLITDPDLGAHYIIRDGQVIPVSAVALDQFAGSTTVESFLELRRSLLSTSQTTQDSAQPSDTTPVMFTVALLAIFLVATALTLWLRRSPNASYPPVIIRGHTRQVRIYRRGGNRVNADD